MSLLPFSPLFETETALPTFDATPPLAGWNVGLRHLHALDPTREDVSTDTRQFMVSAFYPALPDTTAPRARLTDILAPRIDTALELLARENELTSADKGRVFTHLKALTLRAQREMTSCDVAPCPVLLYYPGGSAHRLSNAALCEALASTGYVVFALDAPRDAPVVALPDGQLVLQVLNSDEDYIWPRVADVRFLLDQLADLNTTRVFAGQLDLNRIGMFGHSRGGYLANICAVEDPRIGAAVNMDGFLWGLWTEGTGLSKYSLDFQTRARALQTPILRLRGDQGSAAAAKRGFETEAKDFGGNFIYIALDGYEHDSFATLPWLNGTPQDFAVNTLQAPPTQRTALLTQLVTEFFDRYLRQSSQTSFLVSPPGGMNVFARCLN